jgi:hypothetical protein
MGRYQIQANDVTSKYTDVDTAMFIEVIPIIIKLRKMEYLETEYTLKLTEHSSYLQYAAL